MQLTIVGSSGSVSGPDSPASSYLVQAPHQGRTFSLLLDLGPGAFGALYRYLDPARLDAVALSHLHPDHCLDACGLYVASRYAPSAPWPRIDIYGPQDTPGRLSRAYEVSGSTEPGPGLADWFGFHTWQPTQQIGPFTVETVRTAHPVEAYAIKVTESSSTTEPGSADAVLVYSGDTGPTPVLAEFAAGADLLLCEAAFINAGDNPPGIHLTGSDAAEVAEAAAVSRLVLTHIPPWHDGELVLNEATAVTTCPTELAAPGRQWTLGWAR